MIANHIPVLKQLALADSGANSFMCLQFYKMLQGTFFASCDFDASLNQPLSCFVGFPFLHPLTADSAKQGLGHAENAMLSAQPNSTHQMDFS